MSNHHPAVRAALRVGPMGHVLGVDPSEALLQMAREKAVLAGVSNLELRAAAAESLEGVAATGHFDAATVRWGLMYMASPPSALASAHRALKPDGVVVAAVWAEPERVPYFTLPRRLLERYRSLPAIDFEVPGTFRHADPGRLDRDFGQAGSSWRERGDRRSSRRRRRSPSPICIQEESCSPAGSFPAHQSPRRLELAEAALAEVVNSALVLMVGGCTPEHRTPRRSTDT